MLNNTFTIVGMATADFKEVGSETFKKHALDVEVSKKNGFSSTFEVVVMPRNTSIDVNASYIGKTLIVNGYVDCYKGYLSLVAQDIYVVGEAPVEENVVRSGMELSGNLQDLEDDEELPF